MALRRATLANKVPYCTNMSTAKVCLEGIKSLKLKDMNVTSLQVDQTLGMEWKKKKLKKREDVYKLTTLLSKLTGK